MYNSNSINNKILFGCIVDVGFYAFIMGDLFWDMMTVCSMGTRLAVMLA